MNELTHRECFLESLDRCSANGHFIPAFYKRFLASSEKILEKFRYTDFEKQNEMLLQSLRLSAHATAGEPESLREIRERAESHDRRHLDISPELYQNWLHSVIETARECDHEWSVETEEAWGIILGFVIEHMVKFY